jgi:ribulose kinase
VRKAPTKAAPEHKPVELDADTRSRLRDLLEVLGTPQAAKALRTSTTHIMDWWTGRRPIPETMPATIRKTHKLIIGEEGL